MKEINKEFVGDFATVDAKDFMSALLQEKALSFITIKKIKITLEVE